MSARFVPGVDGDGDDAVLDSETGKVYGFIFTPARVAAAQLTEEPDLVYGLWPNETDEFEPLGEA